jgi:BASS family bile acid:Na+ symporter
MSGALPIQFNPTSLVLLNLILALMMFGVSLSLRWSDFKRIVEIPAAPFAGLLAQFLLLPLATCLFTWALAIEPEFALGMILVAACPGGSFSNIMTWLSRGNVAVSVSMTAVSSLAATVLTPLNFAFYAWLNPHTRSYLSQISIEPGGILLLVLLVLALPLVLGMYSGRRWPSLNLKIEKPLRIISLLVFLGFVGIAFFNNFALFIERFHSFFWLVVLHNSMALLLGYGMARLMKLSGADLRAVTLEVGIQNSGLGLVIIFTFYPDAGGMMLITAFWGVWHLVSGLLLSTYWSRKPL